MWRLLDKKCNLELDFIGRWQCRYSLKKSTTVQQLKQKIFQDYNIAASRLTLTIMPRGTAMTDDEETLASRLTLTIMPRGTAMTDDEGTLASYGIRAGQTTTRLYVGIACIHVQVRFHGYPRAGRFGVACYEFDALAVLRDRIAESLRRLGLREVGAEDLVLHFNGVKLEDLGAKLDEVGMKNMSWVEVTGARAVREVQVNPSSAL